MERCIKLLTYPDYVDLEEWIRPRAFRIIAAVEKAATIRDAPWDGTLESMPHDEKVMVWASSMLMIRQEDLVARCRELGHFSFYGNLPLGYEGKSPEEAVKQWLEESASD
ncbi:MAG: hypothetical protein NT039_01820 [Candidatus Berkelbacteria bacterium]|nr:hypothetical protein [Candidatus Berkelbacteria bacterium]